MKYNDLNSTPGKRYLVLALPSLPFRTIRRYSWVLALIVLSNALTHAWLDSGFWTTLFATKKESVTKSKLYLLDKAAQHIADTRAFEQEVRKVAAQLRIPPEWLMSVMYTESGFDPAVVNRKGSGAAGLIQFMPISAGELKVSLDRLRQMNPIDQLHYVHRYLETVRQRYGDYQSLTDLYLGILYPKARGQDFCFSLYSKPSKAYRQNSGLDENKDGNITVSDIDARMRRLFGEVYGV